MWRSPLIVASAKMLDDGKKNFLHGLPQNVAVSINYGIGKLPGDVRVKLFSVKSTSRKKSVKNVGEPNWRE